MKSHLVVLLVSLFVIGSRAADTAEPTYEGKPVTFWMDRLACRTNYMGFPPETNLLARWMSKDIQDMRSRVTYHTTKWESRDESIMRANQAMYIIAHKAFAAMGYTAAPYIMRWNWHGDGGQLERHAPGVLASAINQWSDIDKQKLFADLDRYWKSTNEQERASAMSLSSDEKVAEQTSKYTNTLSPIMQLAFGRRSAILYVNRAGDEAPAR